LLLHEQQISILKHSSVEMAQTLELSNRGILTWHKQQNYFYIVFKKIIYNNFLTSYMRLIHFTMKKPLRGDANTARWL